MSNFDLDELCKTSPPELGHATLKYFAFDPEYINLNNGAFGSLPLPVLAECDKATLMIERNPDYFRRLQYQPILNSAREQVAKLIGAQVDECVLIPNATHGVNTVLRNFEWESGDSMIDFSTTHGSISNTVQYLSDKPPHPSVSLITLNFPTTHAEILAKFRAHVRSVVSSKLPGKKVVAVIDSIASNPGVLLPWQEMVKVCQEAGVYSVIDAAHSIGQELNINLSRAQPDFWISNCHKWLYTKRGCAVLYVPKRNQHLIKSSIPTSHAYVSPSKGAPQTFQEQFDWNGTFDFVRYCSVLYATRFREWLGGETKINAYCHKFAIEGGRRLAEIFGTRVLDPDGSLTLNMVNVELPLSGNIQPTAEIKGVFQRKLLQEHNVYSAHFHHNGRWWTRCSVQVYNEITDFERLGNAYLQVCKEIERDYVSRMESKL